LRHRGILEVRVRFELTVLGICSPLHWATLPPHCCLATFYKYSMIPDTLYDILHGHCELDNDAIIKKCYHYARQSGNYQCATWDNVQTFSLFQADLDPEKTSPHNWEELAPLINLINSFVPGATVSHSWFLISNKGSRIDEHQHPTAKNYVFVYYPFIHPDHPSFEVKIADKWSSVPAKSSDWIQASPSLPHRVGTNTLDLARISISIQI